MKGVAHGFPTVFHTLVSNINVDVSRVDKDGLSIIHYITRLVSSMPTYREFLGDVLRTLQGRVDINGRDRMGRTALMYAVIDNSFAVAADLLQFDADPRMQDSYNVSTAAMCKDSALRQLLVEASADLTIKEHSRWEQDTRVGPHDDLR
jgi:ankyrin repeat protein